MTDLKSFSVKIKFPCRSKVLNYFKEKLKENKNLLDSYLSNIQDIEKQIEEIKKNSKEIITGKIFTIPKKSWKDFSKDMEKKYFRSFSIIEKGEELKVYFL